MQAGIQLKNHLYSKDYEIRCQYQQRWLSFPDDLKNFVKTNVSKSSTLRHIFVWPMSLVTLKLGRKLIRTNILSTSVSLIYMVFSALI